MEISATKVAGRRYGGRMRVPSGTDSRTGRLIAVKLLELGAIGAAFLEHLRRVGRRGTGHMQAVPGRSRLSLPAPTSPNWLVQSVEVVANAGATDEIPPNETAREHARRVLDSLAMLRLQPERIVPIADGGVAFCFFEGEAYADIECLNSGSILVTTVPERGLEPSVSEVELGGLGAALRELGAFLADA